MTNEADRDPREERRSDGTYRADTRRRELELIVARRIYQSDFDTVSPAVRGSFLIIAGNVLDAIYEHCKEPTPEMAYSGGELIPGLLADGTTDGFMGGPIAEEVWRAMFPKAMGRDE